MITADQPTIFPETVVVAVSSVEDGSMKDGSELMTPEAVRNREQFLKRCGMSPERAAVHFADFSTDDYCVYKEATAGLMPGVDGASTQAVNQPILLPLADCVGAVLYDPIHHAMMVSHLGRHSTEQQGGVKSVGHMTDCYDSEPEELLVWLGPSPNSADYPLWKFNNRGFTEVLLDQLQQAGIRRSHIEVSSADTATNLHYFSHSQFLKGRQTVDGRFAIIAELRQLLP